MPLIFPNVARANSFFISGQDFMIDNFAKNVTLYYPTYISGSDAPIGPGNMGNNFLADGSTSFDSQNDFLAGSGTSFIQIHSTGNVQLLCTFNPQDVSERFKKDANIGIDFKKELQYVYSRGYMKDFLNVIKAEYAVFDMPVSSVVPMKFRLASYPRDKNSIAQGRYFNCWWEQIA